MINFELKVLFLILEHQAYFLSPNPNFCEKKEYSVFFLNLTCSVFNTLYVRFKNFKSKGILNKPKGAGSLNIPPVPDMFTI